MKAASKKAVKAGAKPGKNQTLDLDNLVNWIDQFSAPQRILICERIRDQWQETDSLWPSDFLRLMAESILDNTVEMQVVVKLRASDWQKLIADHREYLWNNREALKPIKMREGGAIAEIGEAVSRVLVEGLHATNGVAR